MRIHIIHGAKPIKNRNFKGNGLYLRDEIFEPLRKGEIIPLHKFEKQYFEYKTTSSFPLIFSDAASYSSLFLHESLIPILEKFNVQKHNLIPFEVNMKEQKLNYFLFNYHGFYDEEFIDFTKTEFAIYDYNILKKTGIRFKDYQSYYEARLQFQNQKDNEQCRISKLVFKNKELNKCDLFYLKNPENRMVISDRMYESILNLNIKRVGLEFVDFLTVHLGSLNQNELPRKETKEDVMETIDFGNLTNHTIKSGIVNHHEILIKYFNKLDIQKEVNANQSIVKKTLDKDFLKLYKSKLDQILAIYNDPPINSLVSSANVYFEKLNSLISEDKLKSEIIVLGTSFANHCFYTEHLIHGQDNTQIDIGEHSFYLTWDSNHHIPFGNLPFLDILEDQHWLDLTEDYEWLPCIENLIELHHNALRMMFYKTFQLSTQNVNNLPIALSLEYYNKEDLDFIYI